jgi:hypothetical protein
LRTVRRVSGQQSVGRYAERFAAVELVHYALGLVTFFGLPRPLGFLGVDATGATNTRGNVSPGYASTDMAPFKSSVDRIVYVLAPVLPLTSWPSKVSIMGSAMPAEASFEVIVRRAPVDSAIRSR